MSRPDVYQGAATPADAWARAVEEYYQDCYWPGPWTLTRARDARLVGRATKIEDLVYLISEKRLTVLHGDSGVGKSSLIEAGLIPALQDEGFVVLRCNSWRDTRPDEDRLSEDPVPGLSRFMAAQFREDLVANGVTIVDAERLPDELDAKLGRRAVLVLDQFEEVIRQQPRLFADLREWIEELVRSYRVRVLVSLRSEYVHHLTDLDVGAFNREDQPIPPIRSEALIKQVVESGRRRGAGGEPSSAPVVDEGAVSRLVDLWVRAGADQRKSNIRLLHLQAVLYALWGTFKGQPLITEDDVVAFLDGAEAAVVARSTGSTARAMTPTERAAGVFEWALADVVELHVALCADLHRELDVSGFRDVVLEEGVRSVLVRLAEHLSSGGYKVDQEEVHLAELVLADELRTLGFVDDADGDRTGEESARRIIAGFADLAGDKGESLDWVSLPTRDLPARLGLGDRVYDDRSRQEGASAGALFGYPRELVLIEECRRFFFALVWLRVGNLIRSSPSDGGRNFLSLSHDGFGRGLSEWARKSGARPETALHAVTAIYGRAFDWPSARSADGEEPADSPLYSADGGPHRRYVNLRWRSCRVIGRPDQQVRFRNVVFMNCDLRGTSFDDCTFEGVGFVNCLLDGVRFNNCTILGTASAVDTSLALGIDRPLPSFEHEDNSGIAATLAHYGDGSAAGSRWLYSRTSGVAVETAASHTEAVTGKAEDQSGGLTMYGGRLSSLAFYSCDSRDGAEVSLRHVAGTSLDFLEHKGGRIGLFDVAIRGITVSPPIRNLLAGEPKTEIQFSAKDSHLENVWFSAGLQGRAEIERSVVWQLFNGSQDVDGTFTVSLDDDSPHLGISNVPDDDVLGPPLSVARGFAAQAGDWFGPSIRRFVSKIDYRSSREQRYYDAASQRLGPEVEGELEQGGPD